MKETIQEMCKKLCCCEIAADEDLIASELLDSFKIMELICSLEDEFHIKFLPDEIQNLNNFSSVNSIFDIVKRKYIQVNS